MEIDAEDVNIDWYLRSHTLYACRLVCVRRSDGQGMLAYGRKSSTEQPRRRPQQTRELRRPLTITFMEKKNSIKTNVRVWNAGSIGDDLPAWWIEWK